MRAAGPSPQASLPVATCAGMGQSRPVPRAINLLRLFCALIWLKPTTEFPVFRAFSGRMRSAMVGINHFLDDSIGRAMSKSVRFLALAVCLLIGFIAPATAADL